MGSHRELGGWGASHRTEVDKRRNKTVFDLRMLLYQPIWVYLGDNRDLQSGTSQLQQKSLASPIKEKIILWRKRRKLGGVVLNGKSVGRAQEFRVLMVSPWPSCGVVLFL